MGHWDGQAWSAVEVPFSDVTAISGTSTSDAWIGDSLGHLAHWDGHAWTEVPSPTQGSVYGLAAFAPDDVWADAYWYDYTLYVAHHDLLHYDGCSWKLDTTPNVDGQGPLLGLASNDLYLVRDPNAGSPLAHFDGTQWSVGRSLTLNPLYGVWASSLSDAWVVGGGQAAMHWDGQAWSGYAGDNTLQDFTHVWGSGPGDVFIGGNGGYLAHLDGGATTVITYGDFGGSDIDDLGGSTPGQVWLTNGALSLWDGHAYDGASTGSPLNLYGVWLDPGGLVWSVGANGNVGGTYGAVVEREQPDGGWARSLAPTGDLYKVRGTSDSDVWAVGSYGAMAHFDGGTWASVSHPGGSSSLYGLSVSAPDDAWAVGGSGLVLHWNGAAWSDASAPVGDLHDVWAFGGDGGVWIVGNGGVVLSR
jgi:hypothetical protein